MLKLSMDARSLMPFAFGNFMPLSISVTNVPLYVQAVHNNGWPVNRIEYGDWEYVRLGSSVNIEALPPNVQLITNEQGRFLKVQAGANWGIQPQTQNDYAAMGACGPGAGGKDPAQRSYTRECLEHDVYSFISASTAGPIETRNSTWQKWVQAVPSYLLYGNR